MRSTSPDHNTSRMKIVIGTRLQAKPRFWDSESPYYLPQVKAIMVSYAEFHDSPQRRLEAMERGIREYLGVKEDVEVFLDNGAFAFWRNDTEPPIEEYVDFVTKAQPDWYPIPADFIPDPALNRSEQKRLFLKTMEINKKYARGGYVSVVHAGDWLSEYLRELEAKDIDASSDLALGGLVPRLLSTKGSSSREKVIDAIKETRDVYSGTSLHIFGIGGLTTLHLAAVLKVDSIDSVGWRIRAAYGSVFIAGKGERSIKKLGTWNTTKVSEQDMEVLKECSCPACRKYGVDGLKASKEDNEKECDNWGALGAYNRATHNLWTLLREAEDIEEHLDKGDYSEWYKDHVKSPLFRKLIDYALNHSGY